MPDFLEQKLSKQYPGNPGAVYGTMNKLGFMHGNKETAAGKNADKKHRLKLVLQKTKKDGKGGPSDGSTADMDSEMGDISQFRNDYYHRMRAVKTFQRMAKQEGLDS